MRRRKLLAHLEPHLVTGGADGRPDGHDEIGRSRIEVPRERSDGDAGYAGREAAPAGVCRGHGTRARVRDEERHAVRRLYGNGQRLVVRQDDVGLRQRCLGHFVSSAPHDD